MPPNIAFSDRLTVAVPPEFRAAVRSAARGRGLRWWRGFLAIANA